MRGVSAGASAIVHVLDNAAADGAGKALSIGRLGEVAGMLRIGEEGYFCDDRRHVGFIAGVEPVSTTLAAIGADDDTAGNAVVGHAVVDNSGVHDIGHGDAELNASLIGVEGAFVGYFPVVRVAVVMQEYDGARFLVQGIVCTEDADRHALRVVLGAVDTCGHRGVDLHDAGFTGALG